LFEKSSQRLHAEARKREGRRVNNNFFILYFSYTEDYDVKRIFLKLQLRVFAPWRGVFSNKFKQVEYDWCN